MVIGRQRQSSSGLGLNAASFHQIAEGGFGDAANAYPHSMAWFKDHLYVGATRHVLAITKTMLDLKGQDPGVAAWPVKVPADIYELDLRAQVWRYDLGTAAWSRMFTSPLVTGRDGGQVPRSVAFRAMFAFPSDLAGGEELFVSSTGGHQRPESVLFRSHDGMSFSAAAQPRLGSNVAAPRAFREFEVFKGRVFTAPVAGPRRAQGNIPAFMAIMVTSDPCRDQWELACPLYFGDRTNGTVMSLAAFNDHLYAGTLNVPEGFQVWKTKAEGKPPYRWKKVLTHGAYRGRLNQIAETMYSFGDHLYIGSAIQSGGYDRDHNVGPAAPELIRLHRDDSWELIAGQPRVTPEGLKIPLSGRGPGFDDRYAAYIWQMCAHEGWLYVGTTVRTAFLWYIDWRRFPWLKHRPDPDQLDHYLWNHGGCALWRTRDGVNWTPVTRNGFGNPYNFGVRTMVSTPSGLFVGLANPFGPEVAVRRLARWTYEHNTWGGLQVWLGTHSPPGGGSMDHPVARAGGPTDLGRIRDPRRHDRSVQVASLVDEFYGGSGFRHVGLWRAAAHDARAACENLMAELMAFMPDRRGIVLDAACGRGATTKYLLRSFSPESVTGLALEKKDLRVARAGAPDVRFVRGRLPALRFTATCFDYILCVEGPGRYCAPERLFREFFRVLKPGGRVTFSDILPAPVSTTHARRRRRSGGAASLDADSYRNLLVDIGFEDARVEDVTEAACSHFHRHSSAYFGLLRLTHQIDEDIVEQAKAEVGMRAAPGSRYVIGSAARPRMDPSVSQAVVERPGWQRSSLGAGAS